MAALPPCGFEFDQKKCTQRGEHFCELRAEKVVGFIETLCVHTKSIFTGKPFKLKDWQRDDIIRPTFGPVRWSDQWQMYIRVVTHIHVEIGRGNGKSELAAALVLYLLIADGEQSAEIAGAAKDKKQAGKVGEVVVRMKELHPKLNDRLSFNKTTRRVFDPVSHSYYEVIPADAEGELGGNLSGAVLDEFLVNTTPDLFNTLKTSQGKRPQSLMMCFSTAGQTDGWAYEQHKYMRKVAEQPELAPHVLPVLLNTPMDADPWDEANWYHANPALGDFLSIDSLRAEAKEARLDPSKEVAFRQLRLNQWQANTHIWMPMHLYDASQGTLATDPVALRESLAGRYAWGGFDLASRQDLCAWSMFVLPENENDPVDVLFRFWIPESQIKDIDVATKGAFSQWIEQGWVKTFPGNVVVFKDIYEDLAEDAANFNILGIDFDSFGTQPVIEEIMNRTSLTEEEIDAYTNNFQRMSPGLNGVMEMVKSQKFAHHGNPVARWNFENAEVRTSPQFPDLIRVESVNRHQTGKRIDGVPAAAMCWNAWHYRGSNEVPTSAYDDYDGGVFVV